MFDVSIFIKLKLEEENLFSKNNNIRILLVD